MVERVVEHIWKKSVKKLDFLIYISYITRGSKTQLVLWERTRRSTGVHYKVYRSALVFSEVPDYHIPMEKVL